jgi:hypothetical protein
MTNSTAQESADNLGIWAFGHLGISYCVFSVMVPAFKWQPSEITEARTIALPMIRAIFGNTAIKFVAKFTTN